MTTYEQRALEHLDEAIEAREDLAVAYAFKPRDYDLVGRLKADERFHLGAAQVYAALAAAEATSTLASVAVIGPEAPSPASGPLLREVERQIHHYSRSAE